MSDKLKMINGGKTTIYYSPGYLPRAERVASVAESMHNFMEMLFGLETLSFVMVLDEKDWVAELQTGYGIPCAAACSDEAAIYLPARYLPQIALREMRRVSLSRSIFGQDRSFRQHSIASCPRRTSSIDCHSLTDWCRTCLCHLASSRLRPRISQPWPLHLTFPN